MLRALLVGVWAHMLGQPLVGTRSLHHVLLATLACLRAIWTVHALVWHDALGFFVADGRYQQFRIHPSVKESLPNRPYDFRLRPVQAGIVAVHPRLVSNWLVYTLTGFLVDGSHSLCLWHEHFRFASPDLRPPPFGSNGLGAVI